MYDPAPSGQYGVYGYKKDKSRKIELERLNSTDTEEYSIITNNMSGFEETDTYKSYICLLYTSPSPTRPY